MSAHDHEQALDAFLDHYERPRSDWTILALILALSLAGLSGFAMWNSVLREQQIDRENGEIVDLTVGGAEFMVDGVAP